MDLLPVLEFMMKIFMDGNLQMFLCREPWIDFNKAVVMVKATRPFPA